MKRQAMMLTCLLLNVGLLFSATFKDLSIEKAIRQSNLQEEMSSVSKDKNFISDYKAKNELFKSFFKSIPEKYTVQPRFAYKTESQKVTYIYLLRIQAKNFIIYMYDPSIDENGLHGYSGLLANATEKTQEKDTLMNPFFVLNFKDFYIHSDGSLESGLSDNDGENTFFLNYSNYIWLEDAHLEKEGKDYLIVAERASHNMDLISGDKELKIGKSVFSMKGKVISCEPISEEQTISSSSLHCDITFASVSWKEKDFAGECKNIYFPALDLNFNGDEYKFNVFEDKIEATLKDKNARFTICDFPFTADSLIMDSDKLILKNAVIYFGNNSKKLGDVKILLGRDYKTSKELFEIPTIKLFECDDRIKILDLDDVVYGYTFDSEWGLRLSFKTKFPNQKDYAGRFKVNVDADGNVWSGRDSEHPSKMKIKFDQTEYVAGNPYKIENGKVFVEESELHFPKNSCLEESSWGRSSQINQDGSIYFYRLGQTIFFDLGNIYDDSFEFTKDGLIISGTLAWTNLIDIPGFFNSYSRVEKLYVGFDGLVKELVVKENDGVRSTVLESGWTIVSSKYSIKVNQTKDKEGKPSPAEVLLCFDDCTLLSPKGRYINGIPVKNLCYRLKGESMDFVYDDGILPDGVEVDLKSVFARKQYNPKDTLRISEQEVTAINKMIDDECEEISKQNLFTVLEKYEYDEEGNLIGNNKPNDSDEKGRLVKEYDSDEGHFAVYVSEDARKSNEKKFCEYYNGLLFRTLYKSGFYGTLHLHSYDEKGRLIKTAVEYGQMDKWDRFRSGGVGEPIFYKYNEHGDLCAEKGYAYINYTEYEYYPNGRIKSKTLYAYNYPTSDM